MKTIQVLDRPEEIAALYGDGFRLVLSNGQEIILQVRTEKDDGKSAWQKIKAAASPGYDTSCRFCGKVCKSKRGKTKHEGVCPEVKIGKNAAVYYCPQKNCGQSFPTLIDRANHLREEHGVSW